MTYLAGQAAPSDPPALHAAVAMAAEIRAAGDEIERERRIPPSIVERLTRAGIFGMTMPRAWGGPELDPLTQARIIEALAMADGSVGWCAMINSDGGFVTAFLEQHVAREMYADILVATAGVISPKGQALPVSGGYRLNGRFPFASGCQHCEWAWLGCIVQDGTTDANSDVVPETRQFLVPISECEILDTWHTTGLRGTGSSDLLLSNVFVETRRSFSFRDPELVKRSGPLYAFPFMFTAKGSAPALGIARHAIDALVEIAANRAARRYVRGGCMEPSMLMRDETIVQDSVGRAEVMLTSARAYLFEVIGDFWTTLVDGRKPTPSQTAHFRVVHADVIGTCVNVVQLMCKTAGGSAVYQGGQFDRCLRDVLTINQHAFAQPRNYELAGRLLLGAEPVARLL
jgi:alkylation response protein AidB-like acyl-CoA dehydrogenase